jgi:hypothetical protein
MNQHGPGAPLVVLVGPIGIIGMDTSNNYQYHLIEEHLSQLLYKKYYKIVEFRFENF